VQGSVRKLQVTDCKRQNKVLTEPATDALVSLWYSALDHLCEVACSLVFMRVGQCGIHIVQHQYSGYECYDTKRACGSGNMLNYR
jgi:hypothetical protein